MAESAKIQIAGRPGEFPFPGFPDVGDGGDAAIWVEKHISQGACTFPITSSSILGEKYSAVVSNGGVNLWGDTLVFIEPESEHSSASASEGFAVAGGRVTNFTSGQGLVLMKEVLYTILGKRLPAVFHTRCARAHGRRMASGDRGAESWRPSRHVVPPVPGRRNCAGPQGCKGHFHC